MTRYATKDCDCPDVITGTGGKRPDFCEPHRERFLTEAQLRREGGYASERSVRPPSGNVLTRVTGAALGTPGGGSEDFKARTRRKRSSGPTRDWSLAQTKKEEEACCRICKRSDRPLESAHILGREHDEPKLGTDGRPLKELWVHPDRVIPACGPFPDGCHGDIDFHRINYMGYLTLSEQLMAVKDAGGIAEAYRALMPVERREERERCAAA